jgi:glycerol-3-phosphate O-acyltransferase/dihydroxyacetone phosphate acyltransferase
LTHTALAGEHLEEELGVPVDGDKFLSFLEFPYSVIHVLILLAVAAIPTLLLNLPVGVLAGIYAEKRRKRALANSKVKVRGYDVRWGVVCVAELLLA